MLIQDETYEVILNIAAITVKAVSDDTIFAHDCLRFALRGVGRNLTQSCAIGCNRVKSYLI